MSGGLRRISPALAVAVAALFVALGGTVYAAHKINGKTIKVKSIPGNRLKPGSVPGDRLKPGAVAATMLAPGSVTGNQVDSSTLGTVPTAVHADSADSARDAETALNAVNAIDAERLNGHSAGCLGETRYFAGACWQTEPSEVALTATAAARSCGVQGGELPSALLLSAFSQEQGIDVNDEGEWSGDIPSFTDVNAYSVLTVLDDGALDSAGVGATRTFRCVIPLVT